MKRCKYCNKIKWFWQKDWYGRLENDDLICKNCFDNDAYCVEKEQ